MSNAKLPIGIQDFETIIADGYTYIDKTQYVYQLITQGKPYFFSRPRRFGKSLLISCLATLFAGKREFFDGLWIDKSDWQWNTYPVIRLDMSSVNNDTPEALERALIRLLNEIASDYGVLIDGETSSDYFSSLIKKLAGEHKVVVLIDEYDKPLIDQIDRLDVARMNRDLLRRFYSTLKTQDHNLKFVFLTGVTQFSKVSVFSGLNNLNDLSMSDHYSGLFGYTRNELERYFNDEIQNLASLNSMSVEDCYEWIKQWYNGYRFSNRGECVYNPFSTLKLLDSKNFGAYWFETGTPTFLIKLIQTREFDLIDLEQYEVGASNFTTFEIEELPTLALLYQTGYLTIKEYDPVFNRYRLGYPNREVGAGISERLVTYFAVAKAKAEDYLTQIYRNVSATKWDYAQFFSILSDLLALMPYDLYLKQEKHYQSLFYLIIKLAGISVSAEVHTQRGRVDAVIEMKDKILLFEFKLDGRADIAIKQIKEKKYYHIYLDRNIPIYLIGINFNSHLRDVDDWLVEEV